MADVRRRADPLGEWKAWQGELIKEKMTAASHSLGEISEFWTVARRLHTIYVELDRSFELGLPPCPELLENADGPASEGLERVRAWFHHADGLVQVWQFRQLLQSTSLQTEENLRYLIRRHLDKKQKTESDKEKIDFLLVQYFAHCAPEGTIERPITLEGVAHVLEPALERVKGKFPEWTVRLDEKLAKMNKCNSLEELQDSGGLGEAREMKSGAGEHYFDPEALVAFTRFNFLARRAFFRAMHIDLHAIRSTVNELEGMGFSNFDCRDAGLSDKESVQQLRHVVHQWKTPFRAPYSSGGESFHQLIALRQSLEKKLATAKSGKARTVETVPPASETRTAPGAIPLPIRSPKAQSTAALASASPVFKVDSNLEPKPSARGAASTSPTNATPVFKITPVAEPRPGTPPSPSAAASTMPPPAVLKVAPAQDKRPVNTPAAPVASPALVPGQKSLTPEPSNPRSLEEEEDYLQRCVADIADQLAAMAPKSTPGVSTIHLGGCKLLIATWEADAFKGTAEPLRALQRAVAARTILHVCMERHKKNEATDLDAAVEIAQRQAEQMKVLVSQAKEASNIDAAVNLAATAKRLMALVEEGLKLRA